MATSSIKGTPSLQQPAGGVSIAPECHIFTYKILAGLDETPATAFATTIPGIDANTKIVGLVPMSATAGALLAVWAACTTNTLTISFTSSALAGTEVWNVTLMTQV